MEENRQEKLDWMDFKRVIGLMAIVGSIWILFGACQSSNEKSKFGNPLITADIRYLMANGELSGTWSFFQRNQVDSLVPDARRHEFIINGQKIKSDKVKNNYHMYVVGDTLISQNLNVQIRPANRVISISMPSIPLLEFDHFEAGTDWLFTWDTAFYTTNDTISLVLSDTSKQTVLSGSAAHSGQLTIPAAKTRSLIPGTGFYYIISKANRSKEANDADFKYKIEVYSEDFPVDIVENRKMKVTEG